jgi:hypothetical protein
MSARNLVEAAVRRGLPQYAELSDAGMRFIVDRLTLKYHQGASLDEVEQRAPRLLMAAEAFDAEQSAARAAARRAGIERRAAEARERAERPLPAQLDLEAVEHFLGYHDARGGADRGQFESGGHRYLARSIIINIIMLVAAPGNVRIGG